VKPKRDAQRNRVYAWENRVIAPRDPSFVSFPDVQGMVNAIWSEMGLRYPPKVEPLPKQATVTVATAARLSIRVSERTPAWCILHEIAHAMTTTAEGRSDGHGGEFMGIYLQLLVRYLRFDPAELSRSARNDGIEVTERAQPVFIDVGSARTVRSR
jgi:hypothetical protein